MDHRKSIAIHESAHTALAKFLGISISYVSIIPTPENDTIGELKLSIHGPLTDKEGKGSWMKKREFSRWIMLESAGDLAEFMFDGYSNYWFTHSDKDFFDDRPGNRDMFHIKQYVEKESIPRSDCEFLLRSTAGYIALPHVWSFIDFLANKLVKDSALYYIPDVEQPKLPLKSPQYDADRLIEFILTNLYKRKQK